jgi:pimeloyl-ACP methyl ester carboxylesterase
MTKTYTEELVAIQATDGIDLTGAVIRPAAAAVRPLPIIWVHGFTGRFYEPQALAIGRRLAERGHVFITGNNRGSDFGAVLRIGNTTEAGLGGAGWEKLDESPRDIAAWIGYSLGLGFSQVILVGHSLGGMKSTYYMATEQDPRVKGLVIASGPVWRFVGPTPDAAARQAEAERLVAEGRGVELMLPFSGGAASTVSAQAVVGGVHFREVLFGAHGQPPAVALLRCPVFAFLGSDEPWLGVPADLERLKTTATAAPRCDIRTIEGADHVYTGHEQEVADAIADWVATLS